MESYPLCAVGMTEGKIWLDFDLKLDAVQPTGEEMLHVQVWNWDSQAWSTVAEYSNVDGRLRLDVRAPEHQGLGHEQSVQGQVPRHGCELDRTS